MPDRSASVLAAGREVTQGGRPNFSSPLVGLVNPRSVKLEIPATSRALVRPPRSSSSPLLPSVSQRASALRDARFHRISSVIKNGKCEGCDGREREREIGRDRLSPRGAVALHRPTASHSFVRLSSESRRSLLFRSRVSRCERTARETTCEDCRRVPTDNFFNRFWSGVEEKRRERKSR